MNPQPDPSRRPFLSPRAGRFLAGVAAVGVTALAAILGAASKQAPDVQVGRLTAENWEALVPDGKEVDAIYGDYVLKNKHLTAVVAQPLATRHANMTVRDIAGALIDLSANGSGGGDQLSAFYPGRRTYPYREASAELAEGESADLQTNALQTSKSASITVTAAAGENRPAVETTYSLGADDRHIVVATRFKNTGKKPVTVTLEDDVRADGGKEDMGKSPNGVSELFWIHDRFWRQAYGLDAPKMRIQSNSDSRTSRLVYQTADAQNKVTIEPGRSYELTRRIFPGAGLIDVKAVAGDLRGVPQHPVRLNVVGADGRPVADAVAKLSQGGSTYGTARTDDVGVVSTRLPQGKFDIEMSVYGSVVGRSTIDVAKSEKVQKFESAAEKWKPGTVVAKITDARGEPIPCKVQFIAKDGRPNPDFGPETAEYAVRNIRYAPHGEFEQSLSQGRYDVIVSHGPEYDAIFKEIKVPAGGKFELTAKLIHSVKTVGWVSSDFHSHSSPSGDNTGSQFGRVLNLVCEHIEFAPCTEHNRVSTYEPHIERLKIGKFISTVSGIELTGKPLPLNHQNAFPMIRRPRTQDGGGPVTDVDPEKQIERLALWDDRSEKLIQQNHPDVGWLFYDKNGDGTPDSGYERSFPLMDVMEIHPIHEALKLGPTDSRGTNHRVFNWLQLLNQGFRIWGVVNTDAHYNYHGSGGLRNWIKSPTDDPAEINPMDMVHAAETGRLIMSNGPYLEVALSGPAGTKAAGPGEDLALPAGKGSLFVRVQCPNWFDIDRVTVYINGREDLQHKYTREKTPDVFRDGVVKFDQQLELALDSDAHVVVIVGHGEKPLGPVLGPDWGKHKPTAISNPIFVNVDGGGFKPNRDTLGQPLPVKSGTRK